MRVVFHIGWSNTVERLTRALGRLTRVPPLPIRWHHPSGPHFGNTLGLLTLDGASARIRFERSTRIDSADDREAGVDLEITDELLLT